MSVKIPDVYVQEHEKTSPLFGRAFAKGCGAKIFAHYQGGDWAGFGSPNNWKDIKKAKETGHNFYYGDHGIFGRHVYYRTTKNAFFHSGRGETDYKRINRRGFLEMPWKKSGSDIIICPQSEDHHLRYGTTRQDWLNKAIQEISKHTDRKIIIHGKFDRKPLAAFFGNAWAVVVHSSNSAVQAVMAGIPAFNTEPSTASEISCNDLSKIESPYYPDHRWHFASVLCDNEWTLEEYQRGLAWSKFNV